MPRQSKASLTIAHLMPGSRRLDPPPDLGEMEARVFRETVAAAPANHFSAEDLPLLSAYARSVVLERIAGEELAAGAVLGAMPSPWLAVRNATIHDLVRLTTRLRIGPRSRAPSNNRRAAASRRTPSYYETMELDSDAPD